MQMNSIVMAIAGGERIFKLLDEKPEVDDGYVTLVRAKKVDGNIVECENRTGMWAWKHYHKDTDTTTYVEMKGEIVFNGVDFGYTDDKIVLHDVKPVSYTHLNEKEKIVSIEDININDVFVVKPGENIPVDGIVIDGFGAVDESAITGESIPVDKTVGSKVSSAGVNQSGYLKCCLLYTSSVLPEP